MWSTAPMLAAAATTLTSRQIDEIWVIGVLSGVLGYFFAVFSRRATGAYPWRLPPWFWGVVGLLFPPSLIVEAVARWTTRPVRRGPRTPYGSRSYFGAEKAPPGLPGNSERSDDPWGAPGEPGARPEPAAPRPWPAPQPWPAPKAWPAPGTPTEGPTGAPAAPPWPPPLGPEAFQPPAEWQPPHPGQPPYPGQPPTAGQPSYPGQPPYAGQPPYPGQEYVGQGSQSPAMAGPEGWIPGSLYGSSPHPQPPPLFGWYPDPTGRHEERYWDGRHWSDRVADNSVRTDDPLHGDPDDPVAEAAIGADVAEADAGEDVPTDVDASGSASPEEVEGDEPPADGEPD